MATTTTARRARAIVFVAVAAGLLLIPAYRQLFGGRSRFVRDWELFNEVGVGLVVAEFSVRDGQGREAPIDRYAALGRERATAPRWLRTMTGEAGLMRVAGELCARLGSVDLRARARIATMRGWVLLHAGEHDLCRPLPPRPQIPGTRPRGHEDR
ncbi:hypothetical protein [Nannocystis bainbridge]|uniref:Uncharacterized protein n=1 Tax=Nannocystis bainbridge TaxID=2995303 RepID=A0ABT5DQ77_9BACT|nr:hypothetical protein [Nannocystis bainbridge]MDC0715800.1 hypothetical protein [Nannocystis bainbridge]